MPADSETVQAERRLARALQLNRRFQVAFVYGDPALARELVATAVADAARVSKQSVNLMWFLPDDAASEPDEAPTEAASVWVVDLADEGSDVAGQLGRLNRTRDSMGRHPNTTLVVLLRDADAGAPARHAPDLWSVRSFSTSVQAKDNAPDDALAQWVATGDAALEARLAQRPQHRAAYEHGTYRFAYRVRRAKPLRTSSDLRTFMGSIRGYTGWRPWWVPAPASAFPPYSGDNGVLECWMVRDDREEPDPSHSDFWRASHDGRFYLVRGYGEDGEAKFQAGTKLSTTLPIWRLSEALLHAQQVAESMAVGVPQVEFTATWSGLRGRVPTDWPSRFRLDLESQALERDTVTTSAVIDTDVLSDDEELTAIVQRLLRPLYDAFLEEPSKLEVRRNLDDLLGRPQPR